ncbi:MAG: PTS IIA-like nitrogen regulatory protein PtsN [Pseudomonadota bacterium]
MAQDLSQLLEQGQILGVSAASSRKQVLSQMAESLSGRLSIDARDIFDAVIERENLGSTGVGEGVAIPHARVETLDAPIGAFVRLTEGVEFDAIDGQPCDLIFMLLAPHSSGADHLRALAQVSRAFRDKALRDALRSAETSDEIRALLCPKAVAADAA